MNTNSTQNEVKKEKKAFSIASMGPPLLLGLAVGLGTFFGVQWIRSAAVGPAQGNGAARVASAAVGLDRLKGRWVRREGGYVVEVKAVDASGKIEARYLNPRPINVSKAQAARSGSSLGVFLELRDTGYPGCTYQLAYNPQTDQLEGVYYQAAARQQFDVTFDRAK